VQLTLLTSLSLGFVSRFSSLHDRLEDDRSLLLWSLLPDEVAGVDDLEAARGQPLVEKLCIDEWNDGVVAAVDDRDRRRDLR
jgi:hypothetical protein